MRKKYAPWYQTKGLKPITIYFTPREKQKLKLLARAVDKSLTRYITRLLQKHIWQVDSTEVPAADELNKKN